MPLDLEIAGQIRELTSEESLAETPARAPALAKLRDSHHTVARLFAAGLRPAQISSQTGYALSRLSILQNDPAFQELVNFYQVSREDTARDTHLYLLTVARDSVQAFHEKLLDDPDNIADETKLAAAKVFLDRAGYGPVQHNINKNLNLTIAKRLDEKAKEADEAA